MANSSSNASELFEPLLFYWRISSSILLLFTCTASVAASTLLIYVVARFRSLRKRSNLYLLHYALVSCIQHLGDLGGYYVSTLPLGDCIMTTLRDTSRLAAGIFTILMAIESYLEGSNKNRWILSGWPFGRIIVAVYSSLLINGLLGLANCITNIPAIGHYIDQVLYILMLVLVVLLRLQQIGSKKRAAKSYQLKVAEVTVYSQVPLDVYDAIQSQIDSPALEFLGVLPRFIAHSSAVVVVHLLGKEKSFRMAYEKVFDRKVEDYADLEQPEQEEEEEEVRRLPGVINCDESLLEVVLDDETERNGQIIETT